MDWRPVLNSVSDEITDSMLSDNDREDGNHITQKHHNVDNVLDHRDDRNADNAPVKSQYFRNTCHLDNKSNLRDDCKTDNLPINAPDLGDARNVHKVSDLRNYRKSDNAPDLQNKRRKSDILDSHRRTSDASSYANDCNDSEEFIFTSLNIQDSTNKKNDDVESGVNDTDKCVDNVSDENDGCDGEDIQNAYNDNKTDKNNDDVIKGDKNNKNVADKSSDNVNNTVSDDCNAVRNEVGDWRTGVNCHHRNFCLRPPPKLLYEMMRKNNFECKCRR